MRPSKYFGINYSLILNIILFAILFTGILVFSYTEDEVIGEYEENYNDPLLYLEGVFDEGIDIYNSFTKIKSDQLSISFLDNKLDEIIIYYDGIVILNNDTYSMTISYVNQEYWEKIRDNRSILLFNFPNEIPDNNSVTIRLENEKLNLTVDNNQIIKTFIWPQPVYGYEIGFNKPYIFLPISTLRGIDTSENPFIYRFRNLHYIKDEILHSVNSFRELEYYVSTGLDQLNSIWSQFASFKQFVGGEIAYSSPLVERITIIRNEFDNDFELKITLLLPTIILLEYLALFAVNLILSKKFSSFELLYSRGMSVDQLKKMVWLWTAGIPFIVNLMLLGLIFLLNLTNYVKSTFYAILIPWLILHIFATTLLSLRHSRLFTFKIHGQKVKITKKSNLLSFEFMILISIIFLVISIILYLVYLFNDFGNKINNILHPAAYIKSLNWSMIFLGFATVFGVINIQLKNSFEGGKLSRYFSFSLLKRRKILLLFIIIIIAVYTSETTMIYSERRAEYPQLGDFSVRFSSSNALEFAQDQGFDNFNQVEGLVSYLPVIGFTITMNSEKFALDFMTVKLVNETLYNEMVCRNCPKSNVNRLEITNKLQIDKQIYDLITGQNSIDISRLGYTGEDLNFATINAENFDYYPPNIGFADRYDLVASYSIWDKIVGIDRFRGGISGNFLLEFEDPNKIVIDDLHEEIANIFQISYNQIRIRSTLNAIEPPLVSLKLLHFMQGLTISSVLYLILFIDPDFLREIETIYKKYGDLMNKLRILLWINVMVLVSVIFALLSGTSYGLLENNRSKFNITFYHGVRIYNRLVWNDILANLSFFILGVLLVQIVSSVLLLTKMKIQARKI